MKYLGVALVVIAMLLVPLHQVVAADVIEETRYVSIQADPDVPYDAVLNIVNETNNNYTNYNQLVDPFVSNSSIDGGYAGSFLPPAKFQLAGANTSTSNNHLVLASVVEFQRKNLLSGASESWWRCPYVYNWSVNSAWDLDFAIYHVDLPRRVNLTFDYATGSNNYPVAPTNESHPSLVFQRSYTNTGGVNDSKQWFMCRSISLPVNDTVNETTGNYSYWTTFSYCHSWFNVTAPIYPNESYLAVWDIYDPTTGSTDYTGSCWVTATDIGDNGYARALACWNSRTIYELPIDLDSSVIFRVGMGAGVTGTKLQYNDVTEVDHTSSFSNPSFEQAVFGFQDSFTLPFATMGWTTAVSNAANAWVYRDPASESAKFVLNRTGMLNAGSYGLLTNNRFDWAELYYNLGVSTLPSEGECFKFDITMNDIEYVSGSSTYFSSMIKFALLDTTSEHCRFLIRRLTEVTATGITHTNVVYWWTSSIAISSLPLPDTFPSSIFVSIQTDTIVGDTIVHIYDQVNPNRIYFSHRITTGHTGSSPINGIYLASAVYHTMNVPVTTPGQVAVSIQKVTGVERTNFLSWTVTNPASAVSVSKQDYLEGFETIVPDYNNTIGNKNTMCFGFIQRSNAASTASISQTVAVALTNRRVFASGRYRMMFNSSAEPYANSYCKITLGGYSGSWTYVSNTYNSIDAAWHQVSTGHLTGTFTQLSVAIEFSFPATQYLNPNADATLDVDLKLGMFDFLTVYSIEDTGYSRHECHQLIDRTYFNSTNYYTLMMPFKHIYQPDFAPFCYLQFKNAAGTPVYSIYTMPTDFYDDFIMFSVKTSNIPSTATYVTIQLYNFGNSTYLFLYDRNSDFYLNDRTTTYLNYFSNYSSTGTFIGETFFSPFYSLKTTEGRWQSVDSYFTTVPFYYVRVNFVRFVDNDPEIIMVQLHDVDLEDFDVFVIKLNAFGEVYDEKQWLAYLEIRNRPTLTDKIIDGIKNLAKLIGLGLLSYLIGKWLWNAIQFLVPYLEALGNIILQAVVFIISVVIFMIAVWIMWNFTKFWMLVSEGKVQEGLEVVTSTTDRVAAVVQKGAGAVGGLFRRG